MAGIAAYAEIASHALQREKEAELLFRGNAYQAAIASYQKVQHQWPHSLEQLLDREFLIREPGFGKAHIYSD